MIGADNMIKRDYYLQKLIDRGLIDKTKWDGCNTTATYLRVCMLSNGNKQYTPWINCPNKKSDEEKNPTKNCGRRYSITTGK